MQVAMVLIDYNIIVSDKSFVEVINAHALLPLPSYFSITQDEMEKRFGIYKGHSPSS